MSLKFYNYDEQPNEKTPLISAFELEQLIRCRPERLSVEHYWTDPRSPESTPGVVDLELRRVQYGVLRVSLFLLVRHEHAIIQEIQVCGVKIFERSHPKGSDWHLTGYYEPEKTVCNPVRRWISDQLADAWRTYAVGYGGDLKTIIRPASFGKLRRREFGAREGVN